MGAGPIEDAATEAVKLGGDAGPKTVNISVGETPPQSGSEYFGSEVPPGVAPELNPFLPGTQNHVRWENGVRDFAPQAEVKPETSPEEALIKDQHLFIEALLDFIHEPSQVPQFAGAQEQYIRVSMKYAQAKLDQK